MTCLLFWELHLLVYSDCTISPAGGVGLRYFPFRLRSPQTEQDLGLGNALDLCLRQKPEPKDAP